MRACVCVCARARACVYVHQINKKNQESEYLRFHRSVIEDSALLRSDPASLGALLPTFQCNVSSVSKMDLKNCELRRHVRSKRRETLSLHSGILDRSKTEEVRSRFQYFQYLGLVVSLV
jgi:hypothetical protein